MEELERLAHRFKQESAILSTMLAGIDDNSEDVELQIAVSQAKRVRRESTLTLRALARLRNSYSREA